MSPTSSDHPPQDSLREFALGRLPPEQAQGIEQHVEQCPICCDILAKSDKTGDPLTQWLKQAGGSHPIPFADERPISTLPGHSPDVPNTPPNLPGEYEIIGELGRGGMGVVYKARDVKLRRIVAIKTIQASTFDDEDNRSRFHSEALAVARLRHPHIVQLLEVGEANGTPYQVLEYVDGGSLAELCGGRPQEFDFAARLIQALAEAVEHAHSQGVIHRDLKPANILLTADGVAKVTDFGLAKFDRRPDSHSPRTMTGYIIGTPLYMSPEQARGVPGTIGPATDIYSLGAILYELVTGTPPFAAFDEPLRILQALQVQEPLSPRRSRPDLPPDLEVICLKCLHMEPVCRYVSAGELAAELGRFLRGEPILARPLSWRMKASRWCRRNPLSAGLVGGLAIVILMSLAGLTGLYLNAEKQRNRAENEERNARIETAEAERQRIEAQRQKAEADKQREDALAFFDVARRAVETFHTRAMTDPKLKENDFRALRKALLASTVQFHEALIQRRSDDPTLQTLRARAFRQLGDIRSELGETDAALTAYGQAVDLIRSLIIQYPTQAILSTELVGTLHNRARLLAGLGRLPEAFESFREVLAEQESLVADQPDNRRRLRNLIAVRGTLAQLYQQSGRPTEAIDLILRNLPLLEKLADDDPIAENRSAVATLKNNLGALYLGINQPAKALPILQSARDVMVRLVADEPDTAAHRLINVQICTGLADALSRLGHPAAALEMFQEGVSQGRKLVQQHPTVPAYRVALGGVVCNTGMFLARKNTSSEEVLVCFDEAVRELEVVHKAAPELVTARVNLRNSLVARAEALGTLNRHADALRDLDQALPLETPANRPWTVLRRARTLMLLGRVTEGATVAEQRLPEAAGPDLRFFAAIVWSLAADKSPNATVESARYLDRALSFLERLATEGFLKRPDVVQSLRTLPEFAALRRHPAYSRFVAPSASPP